jgi:DUF1009 family protein
MAAAAPLGIVAFGGRLPLAVAEAVRAQGREVFLAAMHGVADPAVAGFPHGTFRAFQVSRLVGLLRGAGCRDVVLAGTVLRPALSSVRFDLGTLKQLALLFAANVSGDDSLLMRVTRGFEGEGFRVLGIGDVAPELIAPEGTLTRCAPGARDEVVYGLDVLVGLGVHDVGQAVVVHGRRVVAVEAAEGTSAMIARVAELRANGRFPVSGRAGVLVKGPKPQQELRNDMPALGPDTVEAAAAAGLAGIAFVAGGVLLIDAARMIARADEAGLWLAGFPAGRRAP